MGAMPSMETSQCRCNEGFCATKEGTCRPQRTRNQCLKDTLGTCSYFGCATSRNATCIGGKCLCSDGHCVRDGKCVPSSEIALTNAPSMLSANESIPEQYSWNDDEDWEIALNVAMAVFAFIALSLAVLVSVSMVFHRCTRKKQGAIHR